MKLIKKAKYFLIPIFFIFPCIVTIVGCSVKPQADFQITNKNFTFYKQDWPEENIDETCEAISSFNVFPSEGMAGYSPYFYSESNSLQSGESEYFELENQGSPEYWINFSDNVMEYAYKVPQEVDGYLLDLPVICTIDGNSTTIPLQLYFRIPKTVYGDYCKITYASLEGDWNGYFGVGNSLNLITNENSDCIPDHCLIRPVYTNYGDPQSTHDSGKRFEGEEGYSNINMETTIEFKKNIKSISQPDWGIINQKHLVLNHITNSDNTPEKLSITFTDDSIITLSIVQNYGEVIQTLTPSEGMLFWYDNTTHDSISEITNFHFNSDIEEI